MEVRLSNLRHPPCAHIYLKHPDSSELGQRIVRGGIDLIHELGFEAFTFRKLAEHIHSTEASVYRYFENKHKLLLYLTSLYWTWMEYRVIFAMKNVERAEERLYKALQEITSEQMVDRAHPDFDELKLHRIVIEESSKAYLTRTVDTENRYGVFTAYKNLVARLSALVLEIQPAFKYPHMLISTVIEGTHLQRFFSSHLPKLTDVLVDEDSVSSFYNLMVFKTLQSGCNEVR